MRKGVETAITSVATEASVPGSDQKRTATKTPPNSNLSHAPSAGVGALIDADLNAASIQISVLQVQQQLGVQALAIANANTQRLLKLFES